MSVGGGVRTDGRPPAGRRRAREVVAGIGPVAGATVMGTGIVSTALYSTGHERLSTATLVVACLLWAGLALVVAGRLTMDAGAVARGARAPEALTSVAATCVLGTRFALGGHAGVGTALLVVGAALWLGLVGPALRSLPARAHGGTWLLTVGTEAVAVLAAALAASRGASWLLYPALALAVLGLVLYVDVLRRFDPRELLRGHGDHWVAGGALAIAALAFANVQKGATSLGALDGLHGTLRVATIAVTIAAALWLPVLLAGEVARPRPHYDARRWATVFPVGMYAAAAAVVGKAEDSALLQDAASVWVWVAVAVWLVVLAGLLRAAARALRGPGTPLTASAGATP